MRQPPSEQSPVPDKADLKSALQDAETSSEELYRTIPIREGLSFDIVIGAEADDPFSQSFAEGHFPRAPLTDLMFQLIRSGDSVLDLGAHIGTFSLAAAALGCRVLSVEASPRNAQLLQASVERNGFQNMQVAHAAVAERAGVVRFIPHGPHGLVYTPAVSLPSVTVRAVTVDQLLAEAGWQGVDLIKMDVECSEIAAIQGMSRLLARKDAPPIIYECNAYTLRLFKRTARQLKGALEALGYRNYLVEPGQLTPVRARDLQPFVVVDYLAVKRWPPRLAGWQLQQPIDRIGLRDKFLGACAHPHQHVRGHAARELEHAPGWLANDAAIQNALLTLRNDALAEVRDAAAWSMARKQGFAMKQRARHWLTGKPLIHIASKLGHEIKHRLPRYPRRSA
jgi:FkbM family methyltransferase